MTYGEELGSEMQQDSIVLTYLEGLLMHQAAGGSGTGVDNGSPGRPTEDQKNILSGNMFSSCQSNGSVLNTSTYQGSGLLHLKKARLLQSSDDWNAAKRRRMSDPVVQLNGKNDALLAGMVENGPKGKQDSTLLASLLQSFSSRLQTVALSQQIRQTFKDPGYAPNQEPLVDEKESRCYGVASTHLKTLLKKNKAKDSKTENLPDVNQNHNDRFIESPKTGQSATKGVTEPLSCAARLQAVASMVEKRSSPAASPKPSVACSQLALLLSSEAHLQQYSQEHAMKAQNASQLASERLAAMARLQENTQQDFDHFQLSNRLSNRNSQLRTPPQTVISTNKITTFPSPMGVPSSPVKIGNYRLSAEKNHSKPSLNNSLLLHLLKSQNGIQKSKICTPNERCSVYENSSTPTTIDEFSDNNPSFTEESSDDESSHSNCAPIDLSFKPRTDNPALTASPSLDNLTQSLLQKWNPKVQRLETSKGNENPSMNTSLKPHQKVTLLQLLLGNKTDEHPECSPDFHRLQNTVDRARTSVQMGMHIPSNDNPLINRLTPLSTPPLFNCVKPDSPINLSHQPLSMKCSSPTYTCSSPIDRLTNPASKHLVDLRKNKEQPASKPLQSEKKQSNAAFSASKLLQNLAQCGMQTSSSVDEPKICKKLLNGSAEKPVVLMDHMSSPLAPNRATVLEENHKRFSNPSTPAEPALSGSEIENLLERRTVLQLLLGTPNKSKNEKTKKPLKQDDCQEQLEKRLNGQVLAVKIKTEPSDESSNAASSPHSDQVKAPKISKCEQSSHAPEKFAHLSPGPVKQEPHSPQDYSFSRNGLLSRLLRQNHDDYPTDEFDAHQKNGNINLMQTANLCTIPKKRKVAPIDPSEIQIKRKKSDFSESVNRLATPDGTLYAPLLHQQDRHCNGLDSGMKYNVGHGAHSLTENRSMCRESKGFNVLKQLLLSENCIRDMSQHRNTITTDGLMNGIKSNMANKTDYSTSSTNGSMGNHAPQTPGVDHRTFQYPSAVSSPSLSIPEHFGSMVPRPELGQFSVCPTTAEKGPIRWVITGTEKGDFGRDSPRLTKTNPILYYMLQKGGHAIGSREAWGRNGWCESSLMDNAAHAAFKADADREAKDNFLKLQNAYNHMKNVSFRHNGSGDIFANSDKVPVIKKEPE